MPLKLTTQAKSPTWSPTSWVRAAQLVILCLFWEKKLQGKWAGRSSIFLIHPCLISYTIDTFDHHFCLISYFSSSLFNLLTFRKRFVSFVSTFLKLRFGFPLNLLLCLGNKDFRWVELHCRPQCDQTMNVETRCCVCTENSSNKLLVGGFNPFEKYESKWVHLPQIGMNIQNIWVATTNKIGRTWEPQLSFQT